MKTMTKKLINSMLCLSMMACSVGATAFAEDEIAPVKPAYEPIAASQADNVTGANAAPEGGHIGGINMDAIIEFYDVDFGNDENMAITDFCMEIGLDGTNGGTVSVYIDPTDTSSASAIDSTGTKIAMIETVPSGGWETWQVQKSQYVYAPDVKGIHDLYLICHHTTCGNIKSLYFEQKEIGGAKWALDQEIPALLYDDILNSKSSGSYIGNNGPYSYIRYDGVDFGDEKTWKEICVEVGVSDDTATRGMYFYILNDESTPATTREEITQRGTQIAKITTVSTGGWSNFQWQYSKTITPDITGIHSVYVIFTGNHTGNLKTLMFSTTRRVDAYTKIEAETADESERCSINSSNIGGTNHNSWAKFSNIDFSAGVPNYFIVKASVSYDHANGTVEVYADDMEAENLVTRIQIEDTGSFDTYRKFYVELDDAAKAKLVGTKNIYLKFLRGVGAVLGNIDNFQFAEKLNGAYDRIYFGEDVADWHSSLKKGTGKYNNESHSKFGSTNQGYWVLFENMDFGKIPAKELSLIYGAPDHSGDAVTKAKINVFIDNMSSEAIYSDISKSTGGFAVYTKNGPYAIGEEITGLHDVYVNFGFSGTCDFMGIEFKPIEQSFEVQEGSVALYDIDGEAIQLDPNGALLYNTDFINAICTVENNTVDAHDAAIILAIYEPDGTLARVAVENTTIESGEVKQEFGTYIDLDGENLDITGYTVKVMVWNGLNGMLPLPGGSL